MCIGCVYLATKARFDSWEIASRATVNPPRGMFSWDIIRRVFDCCVLTFIFNFSGDPGAQSLNARALVYYTYGRNHLAKLPHAMGHEYDGFHLLRHDCHGLPLRNIVSSPKVWSFTSSWNTTNPTVFRDRENTLTLLVRSPPVPGPDASLFQALTKKRWKKKIPTATIFTAKGHRRRRQNTSCLHQNCHPGAAGLVLPSEGTQRVKCVLQN